MPPETESTTSSPQVPPPNGGNKYSGTDIILDAITFLFSFVLPVAGYPPLTKQFESWGVSMNWLLFLIPIGIIIFYKRHRTKVTDEAVFVFRQAPLFIFIFAGLIVLLVCKNLNLDNEKSFLAGQLKFATNPPVFFGNTNTPQITLSDKDFNYISEQAKQFAEVYSKTNGHRPKIVLCISSEAKSSNHLMRQIKDAAVGWEVEIHGPIMLLPSAQAIDIYQHNYATHPSDIYSFWMKSLGDCSIDIRPGDFGPDMLGAGAFIEINDPLYFP